jgi:hypothetical protein
MKKLYTLLTIILSVLVSANAQPTITATDFNPYIGLAIKYYTFTPFPFDGGPAGAGVTWDFSQVSANDSVTAVYVDPATTIHAASFPTATIANNLTGIGFEYLNANSNFIARAGIDAQGVLMPYSDDEVIMNYPCTYTTTYTDSYVATFSTGGYTFYRKGTVDVNADAYGTLLLPWGSVSNVLRLHLVENYTDSTAFSFTSYTSDNYIWVTPGTHYYLCSIASVSNQYSGSFLDAATVGLSKVDLSKFLHISPNPTTNYLCIDFAANEKINRTTITDISGKVVFSNDNNSIMENQRIAIDHLTAGYYFVNIETSDRTFTQKFIKQ